MARVGVTVKLGKQGPDRFSRLSFNFGCQPKGRGFQGNTDTNASALDEKR